MWLKSLHSVPNTFPFPLVQIPSGNDWVPSGRCISTTLSPPSLLSSSHVLKTCGSKLTSWNAVDTEDKLCWRKRRTEMGRLLKVVCLTNSTIKLYVLCSCVLSVLKHFMIYIQLWIIHLKVPKLEGWMWNPFNSVSTRKSCNYHVGASESPERPPLRTVQSMGPT